MNRRTLLSNRPRLTIISVVVLCVVAICMSLVPPRKVSAQNANWRTAPVYNPYPPGILPPDLDSELARVLAEVDLIEGRAIARWHALPPLTVTNQPPIIQGSGTEAVETLGELMNYDKNISPNNNQACASC